MPELAWGHKECIEDHKTANNDQRHRYENHQWPCQNEEEFVSQQELLFSELDDKGKFLFHSSYGYLSAA